MAVSPVTAYIPYFRRPGVRTPIFLRLMPRIRPLEAAIETRREDGPPPSSSNRSGSRSTPVLEGAKKLQVPFF